MPAPCATAPPASGDGNDRLDDVALPFLSYAAGLMTAAEITKLALAGHTEAPNRVFYEPRGRNLLSLPLAKNPNCPYHNQDSTHHASIKDSRFASLATTPVI